MERGFQRRAPGAPMTTADGIAITRLGQHLLVTLRGNPDDAALVSMEDEVARRVTRAAATGVVMDVSGLTVVDMFMARIIIRVVGMVRLLGAEAVVVGIQPAVAMTVVELGLRADRLPTALTVDRGVARLRRRRIERRSPAGGTSRVHDRLETRPRAGHARRPRPPRIELRARSTRSRHRDAPRPPHTARGGRRTLRY